jgi:hypothetical protein
MPVVYQRRVACPPCRQQRHAGTQHAVVPIKNDVMVKTDCAGNLKRQDEKHPKLKMLKC